MTSDAIIRTAAVAVGVAILAAPYAGQIRDAAAVAAEALRKHLGLIGRVIAVGLILAAAWGKIPLPDLPTLPDAAPSVIVVEEPSDELRRLVEPVRVALSAASPRDRAIWAEVWVKSGIVVSADAVQATPILPDVRSLRAFQIVALDVAWRRIGGIAAGRYPGLREGTEAAFADVLGVDDVAVDAGLRDRYVALSRALAWAAR